MIPKNKRKRPGSVEGPALEGIALQEASLSHLDDELRCERSLVSDASLGNTRASGVVFDTCQFRRSAFDGSVLRRLRLLDSRLEKCNASNAEWDNAHLRRIEFLGYDAFPGNPGARASLAPAPQPLLLTVLSGD